jgi:O-antigen ligase
MAKLVKQKKSTEKTSKGVWTILLGISAITIYFNTQIADPFNTAKFLLLVVLAFWLLGFVMRDIRNELFSRSLFLFIPIIFCTLFIISILASTYYSDVQIESFLGAVQRRNGFLTYFCLTILLVFTYLRFQILDILKVIKTSILLSLCVGIYGIVQILGFDFVEWNNPYNSIISTLGNPNFASASLAIFTSLNFYSLFLKNNPRVYKYLAVGSILIGLTAIVASESRQGIVALIFSLLFFVSYLIINKYKKYLLIVICISGASILLVVLGMLQRGPLQNLLYKDSISVRGFYWRAAFKMFQESPFVGIGLDRYGAYFRQLREVEYTSRYGYDIYSTNAHNVYLQMFSTGGIFVGIIYTLLQFYILIRGLRILNKLTGENQKMLLVILAAWITYQAQSLISIDNIGLAVWGWLLSGLILAIDRNHQSKSNFSDLEKKYITIENHEKINLIQIYLSVLFVISALYFAIQINEVESQIYKVRSLSAAGSSNNEKVIASISEKILRNQWADPYYKFESASRLYSYGEKKLALVHLNLLYEKDPRNLDYLKALAYVAEQENDISKAIFFRNKVTIYDPWNLNNYLELIRLNKELGDINRVEELKDFVLSLSSDVQVIKKLEELKVS